MSKEAKTKPCHVCGENDWTVSDKMGWDANTNNFIKVGEIYICRGCGMYTKTNPSQCN